MIKNKKFISFSVLAGMIFLLITSWFYFYASKNIISEKTHGLLQETAQKTLSNYISKTRPEIRHIVFHKVWTENTSNPNQIKIFFSYTFTTEEKETGGEFSIESEAYLTRKNLRNNDWILSDFQVKENLLDFSEPLLIKASEIETSETNNPEK